MNLINATRMAAEFAMGLEPSGRELLVVVVKGTFRIPAQSGLRLTLHEEQVPLVMADEFFAEPGLSAPRYESDFAPSKVRCDVLLHGSAYAPGGRPTDRVTVACAIGGWSKSFSVVGDRAWFESYGARSTAAEPFLTMPITYDRAFGGADLRHADPTEHAAFMANPTGRGFHKHLTREWLEGSRLPNTEEIGIAVTRPDGSYRPMSFGPLGRHWDPRRAYAGTYDQHWLDEEFPFLPADFDPLYYQSAPLDQQLALPIGEQSVHLQNLTIDGRRDFALPHFEAPIQIVPRDGKPEDLLASVDTILIEPDLERLTMTWRVARPLRKNMFEIAEVRIGRKGRDWWQQGRRNFPLAVVVEFDPTPTDDGQEADVPEEEAEAQAASGDESIAGTSSVMHEER
jgi:hypothetical protein